ncbi:hypothetical protein FB45DRAFT_921887 [Roridomyces roridus]|uniref:Uncharacterized protein n=1 Tax=Roridomyces roridus TaxID=1738132 RepID=A0AAD7BMR2_9AGAR|nr:hypothetical protein FB45DRAFT_921887 [Roridomyces roridus]
MDSASQPLLPTESAASESASAVPHLIPNGPQPQPFCARCTAELKIHEGVRLGDPKKSNLRLICIFVAMFISFLMFIFSIVSMSSAGQFHSSSTFLLCLRRSGQILSHWKGILMLFVNLLYMGRRRYLLGRTSIQIYILCALAGSWLIFMIAMLAKNHNACTGWGPTGVSCGMFTTTHVLSWFLIATLCAAVYATYLRAVALHGTNLVAVEAPPPLVEAWRLSNIDDAVEMGGIVI